MKIVQFLKINVLFVLIMAPLFLINCSKLKDEVEQSSSSCKAAECHPSTLLKKSVPVTGKHDQHLAKGYECSKCHYNYIDNKNHKNGINDAKGNKTIVIFDSQNPSGNWKNSTTTCESLSCHGSADWYGSGSFSCVLCHASGNTTGAIDPVTTNGAGTSGKHVKHVSDKGIPCEKCHNGYKAGADHANGTLDTGDQAVILALFDSTNPSGAWGGDTGPGTGNCSSLACHGGSTLDWYGTVPWTLPACTDCHGAPLNSLRQVLGAGGDFEKSSHHVIDYGNRTIEIITDADCLVCHDNDSHMTGAVRLKDKDNSGNVIVYDPGNPTSLEPFCLSCHDADGADTDAVPLSPFSNSNVLGTAPNRAGTEIKDSWIKTFGHRAEGLTCMGSGINGTGCHGDFGTRSVNAHGSANNGLLANKFELPILSSAWDGTRYGLCTDCHAEYPSMKTIPELFGTAEGSQYDQVQPFYSTPPPYNVDFMGSHFFDYLSYTYDRQFSLHYYHLFNGLWEYRGTTSSTNTCVSCHNVHGTDNQYFHIWDEWNFTIVFDSGIEYGQMDAGFLSVQYPEFCSFQCHWDGTYRYPRSNSNEAKAVAADTSSSGPGLQNGDTVTIYFANSTNGPVLDESNIASVLSLTSSHTWVDTDKGGGGGQLTAVWSSTDGKTNNVLTITIYIANSPTGDPTIADGDNIIFADIDLSSPYDLTVGTIKDDTGIAVRGEITLTGSF